MPKTPASPPETTATRSPLRASEGVPGAVHLDRVAGGVTGEALALRDPVDVGRVADDVTDVGERGRRLRGEPAVGSGAEADDDDLALDVVLRTFLRDSRIARA